MDQLWNLFSKVKDPSLKDMEGVTISLLKKFFLMTKHKPAEIIMFRYRFNYQGFIFSNNLPPPMRWEKTVKIYF